MTTIPDLFDPSQFKTLPFADYVVNDRSLLVVYESTLLVFGFPT